MGFYSLFALLVPYGAGHLQPGDDGYGKGSCQRNKPDAGYNKFGIAGKSEENTQINNGKELSSNGHSNARANADARITHTQRTTDGRRSRE